MTSGWDSFGQKRFGCGQVVSHIFCSIPSFKYRKMSDKESTPEKLSASPTSYKKSPPPEKQRSRSRSHSKKRHSRSRSRSYGRRRYYSRSRSRSPYGRRNSGKHYSRCSHSRSRSYSPYYSRREKEDYGGGGSSSYGRRGGAYYRSRSRSPMSSRRRHQSTRQENPKTSRCLGVFGLSLYTQERDLREAFSRYGPVEEVQVVYDHQTGRSRGFSFIYFRNLEDAEDAKERAAGTEIDGRKVRCDYSITERAHTPTPGIYLGKPTGGYRSSRHSPSPLNRRRGYSRSRSRSRSYTPRRY